MSSMFTIPKFKEKVRHYKILWEIYLKKDMIPQF